MILHFLSSHDPRKISDEKEITGKKNKKYLTVKVTENGENTLPKEFITEHNLKQGNSIICLNIGNNLLLFPQMKELTAIYDSAQSVLVRNNLSENDFLDSLPGIRQEIFEELYPNLKNIL